MKKNENNNTKNNPSKFQSLFTSCLNKSKTFIKKLFNHTAEFFDEMTDELAPIFNGFGKAVIGLPSKILKNIIVNIFYNIDKKKVRFGSIIFMSTIVIFAFSMYLLIDANKVSEQVRPVFDRTGFVNQEDLSQEVNKLAATSDNGRFELYFDETTSYFTVKDTLTNEVWKSNVTEEDDFEGIIPATKNLQKSIFTIYYSTSLNTNQTFNSYTYSISEKRFSVKYTDDGVEVLYNLQEKDIYYIYFPKTISNDRMLSLILNKLDKDEQDTVNDYYNYNAGTDKWTYMSKYERMTEYVYNKLKPIFDKCGYTMADVNYDNEQNNVNVEDKSPAFQVGVKYTITDKGFDAKIINDSIVEKPNMPIMKIDFLSYFGASDTTDEGYILLPDGSGALMNLNNGKVQHEPYSKRIYGKDNSRVIKQMPQPEEALNMPMYGYKRNNSGYIAIIDEGAPLTFINADTSERKDSYNKVYPSFTYRETDIIYIQAGKELPTKVDLYTKYLNETDFTIKYEFLTEEEANYVGMAKKYQEYLISNGLTDKDNTLNPVMNLTLLGGYKTQEYFLGVPYNTVRSLTSFDEAKKITKELNNDGVNNINLVYSGWMNGGIKHSLPVDINFDRVVGNAKEFNELIKYMNDNNITLYPEVSIANVYNKDNFNPSRQAARVLSGDIAKHYQFNLAGLVEDYSKDPYWTLAPDQYKDIISRFLNEYSKYNIDNLSLADFASVINGSYKRQKNIYRTESQGYQTQSLVLLENKIDNILLRNPLIYTLKYSNAVIDLPVAATKYNILDQDIPFYQLVLSGLVDYAGPSFNIEDQYSLDWHKLKAIETGSNLNFTWSYKDSSNLMNTEYDYYYSTYYKNWIDFATSVYQELDDLGIYKGEIINHEIINESVRKVTYSNGLVLYINYGNDKYYLTEPEQDGNYCEPRNYYVVEGAN